MEIKIGVVGYSGQKFNETVARALVQKAFDEVEDMYDDEGTEFVVVSGLTNLGIPALAYREADRRDWSTVGVACKKAEEYDLYPVDVKQIVGEDWGDESETFLGMLDLLIRIGGGKQSLAEAKAAKDKNLPVIEYDLAAEPKK